MCSYETTINDLFQDLSETFTSCANGQFELEESVEAMLEVIKAVNDSLHQINIKVGASYFISTYQLLVTSDKEINSVC